MQYLRPAYELREKWHYNNQVCPAVATSCRIINDFFPYLVALYALRPCDHQILWYSVPNVRFGENIFATGNVFYHILAVHRS